MNNYFIDNSINKAPKCGWINCNNTAEAGKGRCEMHERADKNAKIANLTPKQKLVLSVIKNRPEAADSDAVLQAEVWLREGWSHFLSLEDNLRRVTHAETLSRRRRELFNLGLIEYSPKAMKSREQAFKNERDKVSPIPPHIKAKKLDKEELWEKAQKVAENWPSVTPEQTRMI